ncbi:MAG: sigma-70 family RNA polymerase sigma factor [Clostridia bacterium]|nr:sigma-70 family RNA polymerase sigma factor [Clostridia bacterium]
MDQTGSLPAFAEPSAVFERYADTVYRLALMRTQNRADSDDILQEVFLRYLRVWKTMQSEEHVKAMLIRMTLNRSKSLLSSAWFRKTEPLGDFLPAKETPADDVLTAVWALPEKYRTVVHLHYYHGYSVEETADLLSLSPSAVKTRLFRARETLKKQIKAEDL